MSNETLRFESENKQTDSNAKTQKRSSKHDAQPSEAKKAGYFKGPLDEFGQRIWQCPKLWRGFKLSGIEYAFKLPSAEDYSLIMHNGLRGLADNLSDLDGLLSNAQYVNPEITMSEINMWELELLRDAYLEFLRGR